MTDAQQQSARARRERVIILATDLTGKTTVLTPRAHPGVSDEDYLNDLRTQMAVYFTEMNYAREVIAYEPISDTGAPAPASPAGPSAGASAGTSAGASGGKGSVESPIETLIEFPAEWTR